MIEGTTLPNPVGQKRVPGIWILLGGALLLVLGAAVFYNRLVGLNEAIPASWAQVENVLKRRADLIPNLVRTVKGYVKHEREIFVKIAEARAAMLGARTLEEKVQKAQVFESLLGRLLAIAENYPNLKANESFLKLQDELSGTENRITVERMRYNEVVKSYNTGVAVFPSNLVAKAMGFSRRDIYFKASETEKVVPHVELE